MPVPRSISLATLIIAVTAWASSLVLLGLWLTIDGMQNVAVPLNIRIPAGLSAIAAGMLVFMVGVADSLFPGVRRGNLTWRVELGTIVLLIGTLLALSLALSRGA